MTKLYVNYGLTAQSQDGIIIHNDGKTYNTGYYSAYTNSNVKAENGATYWYWPTLNLPFANNQTFTVIGN